MPVHQPPPRAKWLQLNDRRYSLIEGPATTIEISRRLPMKDFYKEGQVAAPEWALIWMAAYALA